MINQDQNLILFRRYYFIAKLFGKIAFWFWLIETIFFMYKYGLHVKAINEEVYFDQLAMILGCISAFYFARVLNMLVKAVIHEETT